MVEVQAALELIVHSAKLLPPETIAISASISRTAASDVTSPEDLPRCPTSSMDGYALRSSDSPGSLALSTVSRPGEPPTDLQPGCCAWVTTGAPIPISANAVCPVELAAQGESGTIKVPQCESSRWIRAPGSDITQGERLIQAGDVIAAADAALLASVGISTIAVIRKPKVGVLSTGNELVDYTQGISQTGQVRDSNRLLLSALLLQNGAEAQDYGIAPDDKGQITTLLRQMAQECDLVITSGGVSMGDLDLVKPVLEEIGQVAFGRVNMKPGKPTTFGKIGNTPVFALPGNPVSCLVAFYLFVCAWLQQTTNTSKFPTISVKVAGGMRLDPERPEYHRAKVAWDGERFVAVSTGEQASSRLLSAKGANCLLCLPKAGSAVAPLIETVTGVLIRPLAVFEPGMSVKKHHSHAGESCKCHSHFAERPITGLRFAVLTVSDRAAKGVYEDESGKALKEMVIEKWPGVEVSGKVVADEKGEIQESVEGWCREGVNCVLTTGGTGFSERDITPESIAPLLDRQCPGLVVQMLTRSLSVTPMAMLSRPVAGIRLKTLIITLPGSLKGAKENFSFILPALDHALTQLAGSR